MAASKLNSRDLMSRYIPDIFTGVSKAWKDIIISPAIKPSFNAAISGMNQYLLSHGVNNVLLNKNGIDLYIRPRVSQIFEFMKYCEPDDIKCIIIGQDPYKDVGVADGLAFSSGNKHRPIPASLNNIYATLHINEKSGSLVNWAKQGILLMNRYLTRSPIIVQNSDSSKQESSAWIDGKGDDNNIHTGWETFTDAIVQYLVTARMTAGDNGQPPLYLVLWGTKAAKVEAVLPADSDKYVVVLKWQHPSPIIAKNNTTSDPKSFRNCPHFDILTKELGIQWNPSIVQEVDYLSNYLETDDTSDDNSEPIIDVSQPPKLVVCACDGGCIDNGSKKAKAGYGVYFPAEYRGYPNVIGKKELCGKVLKYEMMYENGMLRDTNKLCTPTNNRGELLAAINALITIINAHDTTPYFLVVMILDSTYVLNTIGEWIWKWHDKNITFAGRPNVDLLHILYKLLCSLSTKLNGPPLNGNIRNSLILSKDILDRDIIPNAKGLVLIHQYSHLKKGGADTASEEQFMNEEADRLANQGISMHRDKAPQ